MLKRSIAAIRRNLFSRQSDQDPQASQDNDVCATRRSFFKRAAVGAVSITGTAGVAKAVVDSMPRPNLQDKYATDGLAGEEELKNRDYVLMSEQEKADMVESFISNHSTQA